MAFLPLKIPMGFKKNGTDYECSGRWLDGNLVRFYQDSLRPVGGWQTRVSSAYASIARSMHVWEDTSGSRQIAAATYNKLYYTSSGGTTTDITPSSLQAGNIIAAANTGYGGGNYSNALYGTVRAENGTYSEATTWSLDNWGEYLVACSVADGKLWEWQLDINADAAQIANAPVANLAMMVTEERFMFALGAGGNSRKVQWCDREDNTLWAAAATNEAGDIELQTNGQIMAGVRTRGQSLILTDTDAHSCTYVGPPFVHSFERVGSACGLVARKAVATTDVGVFWMGKKNFFLYNGSSVQEVPCEVYDYVFSDINPAQLSLAWAMNVSQYGEVWFFFASGSSNEIDKYVAYDYREGHWIIGSLIRTTGADSGVFKNPLMVDVSGNVYNHEQGFDYDGLDVFAESAPISVGAGDDIMSVKRLIPDELTQGQVQATFKTKFYPNGTERSYGPYSMANPTDVRFKGRQIRMRVTGAAFADWRAGTMRIDATTRGKR